jgi:phosphatidate phosphatase APP1
MKRPYLVNFIIIESDNHVSIRASLSSRSIAEEHFNSNISHLSPSSPIQSLSLLNSYSYKLLIVGLDEKQNEVYRKEYESDSFGNFEIRFSNKVNDSHIQIVQAFETSKFPGLELLMGTFIPVKVKSPKKIVISDFDKTLVDTKYSTPKEMYESLRRPIEHFPKIPNSIELLKEYINDGYQSFILSASPHFYEKAIRDWLYQNQIFTGNIILKDYRKVFSLFEGDLTPKDLKSHGFYKLSSLVSILLMTGVPDELVLIGDGFETDPLIYLTLSSVLYGKADPWKVWNDLHKKEGFRLTTRQQSRFLTKFYRLGNLTKKKNPKDIKIHIRCNENEYERITSREFNLSFIEDLSSKVDYYIA